MNGRKDVLLHNRLPPFLYVASVSSVCSSLGANWNTQQHWRRYPPPFQFTTDLLPQPGEFTLSMPGESVQPPSQASVSRHKNKKKISKACISTDAPFNYVMFFFEQVAGRQRSAGDEECPSQESATHASVPTQSQVSTSCCSYSIHSMFS